MAINSFLLETGHYLETLQALLFFIIFVNQGLNTIDSSTEGANKKKCYIKNFFDPFC
jgi:hypothetical protein